MYTSVVGKTFLNEYNRRNGRDYSAKEFFDRELFKVFFGHDKFMFYVNNSTFDQLVKQKKNNDHVKRIEALETLHRNIQKGEIHSSTAVGFPASDLKEFATTSGLVTDLKIVTNDEDIYLSWIGGALSLGVAGGYSILFDDPEITYATFEGWQHYRRFLNDPLLDKLLPYKLNTWNGQWLAYYMDDEAYSSNFNFSTLLNNGIISKSEKDIEINTVSWSQLFFSLSSSLNIETATAYVFSLGSTNKTVGFIPFQFQSGRNLITTYQALFGHEEYRLKHTREFENWFGRHIKRACELGSIGLHALRPESLKNYFGDRKSLKFVSPDTTHKSGESEEAFQERQEKAFAKTKETIISYQTYKTWLIAMLSKNKTEVSEYSREIAQALVRYRAEGRRNDRKNLLENDFFKTNKNEMLKALNIIVSDETVNKDIVEKMNGLRDQVHFLSKEDFSYFVLLLKFDYSYAEHNSNNQ